MRKTRYPAHRGWKERALKNRLHVTFEGPRVNDEGLAVEDLQKTLTHVQRAVRLMVGHLMGSGGSVRGRPLKFVRDQSALRIVGTSAGSLVVALELSPPAGTQRTLWNHGQEAVNRIVRWEGDKDRSLPQVVAEELMAAQRELSAEVDQIRLTAPDAGRSLTLTRMSHFRDRATSEKIDATLQGRLMVVNWMRRTAELHNYGQPRVRLRFGPELDEEMQRRATQYVEVRGRGQVAADGSLVQLHVGQISGTRSSSRDSFDLEEILNAPNPKIFDPKKVVRATEPFDVDHFMRVIREGRDA